MSVAQSAAPRTQHPSVPFVLPFALFMAFLAASEYTAFLGPWEFPLRACVLAAALWIFSRDVIDFRVRMLIPTVAVGAAVFVLWIAPDLLFPGYRQHWLFQNPLTGELRGSIPEAYKSNLLVLIFRTIRAVILVPIIEELFWRVWMMRWLINPNFQSVPLGAWTRSSLLITALLFASEHGPYWDVGMITGLIYNFWMIRTRSLGDCILMHAVTNACLSAYVLATGSWQYWL